MPKLNRPLPSDPNKKIYESDATTSSKEYFPSLEEDVVRSTKKDAKTMGKGFSTNESPSQTESRRNAPQGNLSQRDAAGRAILRMAGRAGLAGNALLAGYDTGRNIDEDTGIGKKFVDESGLGNLAAKFATPDEKVELTDESKSRIARGELDQKPKTKLNSDSDFGGGTRSKFENKILMENREPKEETLKRGGKVKHHAKVVKSSASKRGDGIAQRGHTRGRMR
jgi:hypothetical protein